jgi:cell division septation protein DedD
MTSVGFVVALFVVAAHPARSQDVDSTTRRPTSAMDSAFVRARSLVISGQTAAGRAIVDSIFAATPTGTVAYGDALYGRATVAPTAEAAAQDYQRIVVEYPLSRHAGDALLQLAQLERSQGDRASAIRHLERFLRENPTSSERGRTGLWLAQLLFEQNDDIRACAAMAQARRAASPEDVELQNRLNFYTPRCDAATARARADSTARADSIRADSIRAAERRTRAQARGAEAPKDAAATAPRPAKTAGAYSVQVGAFATEAEANKLVERLHARGIEARVDGVRKPFRVRVGHFKTHADAGQALAHLKQLGIDGFVASASQR